MLDLRELRLERLRRRILHGGIERRVDGQPAVVDLLGREKQIQVALDRVHRVILLDQRHPLRMRSYPRHLCFFRLGPAELLQFHQPIEDRVALMGRAFRILQRRKSVRTPNQPRQSRGFRKVQLRRVFPD